MLGSEWVAHYNGHKIRVTNALLGGAKLYIDGDCRDTNTQLFVSPSRPVLSARVEPKGGDPFVVEVFVKAVLTIKAKICVNGNQIAGDVF